MIKLNKKKKAFTLIELIIVIAIIAILTAVTAPKVAHIIEKSKVAGVEKTQKTFESLVTSKYNKHFYEYPTEAALANKIYTVLSQDDEYKNYKNPLNKAQQGVGLLTGTTFTDSNKAIYIFTNTPTAAAITSIPKGVIYVVIKDAKITSDYGGSAEF
ncbi:prepilin-type N-terminal cleavage/methylation domain-containing protein [Clostridium tertium]|uniref:prepilin-type N-terminal cleavage/methylation domain-containing protein n=1 Tax=Clostridium tertium TaxID=1559 RepID=UPI0023B3207E|nr:prepilin-type N-terminal cleavage/methylation domain-containing protein [Clostridium tertium]